MANGLYTNEGWLNFDYIASKGAWLNVIIGKRQVGKTYGTLKYMLDNNINHILLRRTTAEIDTIAAMPDLSPYKVFEPDYKVGLFKSGKRMCRICDYETDGDGKPTPTHQRGIATSLAEISHIRGFNGSIFTDLVYDEFIPEKSVITRKTEGDAFLNAYTTINGNRELNSQLPLRVWLLANTNNIGSQILEALNLTDLILYMRRKGKEELYNSNGIYVVQPSSEKITEARKETALMKQVNSNSDFYGMAIENEFSYDASPYIKTLPLKNLTPVWSYDDAVFCWQRSEGFYICRAPFKANANYRYKGDQTGREMLQMDFSYMKPYYYAGLVLFSDMRVLQIFKDIFVID